MKKVFLLFVIAAVWAVNAQSDDDYAVEAAADAVSPYHDIAVQFAPRFRFDAQQGDTLDKCLPSSAADYYALRKNGFTGRICNMDYITILDGRIPAYYEAQQCGDNYYFSYYLFFGYEDSCPLGESGADADWTRVDVKVTNNGTNLDRVVFYQKVEKKSDGWYTKSRGHYETYGDTHPIAYIGRLRHGSYHDAGGTSTCCYFEDTRNPGSPDKHIDTENNLVWIRNDPETNPPEWMTNNDGYIWNGETLPSFDSANLCSLSGCKGIYLQVCETCGCIKTDVKDNQTV